MATIFGEKIRTRRLVLGIQQSELAQMVGVSERTIYSYEQREASPRRNVIRKLAHALQVSVAYLVNDEETDPTKDLDIDIFLDTAEETFGSRGAREADLLLHRVNALFAGGDLDDAAKDIFFQDITAAYLEVKQEARRRFSAKKRSVKR